MRFRTFLEAAEEVQGRMNNAEQNLERALADPRVAKTLANLATRAAQGDKNSDGQLLATIRKLLDGGNVLEADDPAKTKLAQKIADHLKKYSGGILAAARAGKTVGQNMLQLKVVQITRAAYNEFLIDFMMNFSSDKGAAATALGTVAGMAGKRIRSVYDRFRKKTPPQASMDQYPPLGGG